MAGDTIYRSRAKAVRDSFFVHHPIFMKLSVKVALGILTLGKIPRSVTLTGVVMVMKKNLMGYLLYMARELNEDDRKIYQSCQSAV